jgi:hypothetical protein
VGASGGPPVSVLEWGDDDRVLNPHLPITVGQAEFAAYTKRVIREVFKDVEYTDADRVRPFFPSTSSNYTNTRGELGTVGAILEHPTLLDGDPTSDNPFARQSLRSNTPLVMAYVTGSHSFPDVVVDDLPLRTRFLELYVRILEAALVEDPTAVPLALAEALKVRTITKGPPLLGFALKPLQKFLWKTLSVHPVFKFTGEPVSERPLQAVLGRLRPGEKWLSADYSDATNSLYFG